MFLKNDALHIHSNKSGRLYIYDMTGNQVFTTEVAGRDTENSIQISTVCTKNGMYICQLILPDKVFSKKVMVLR